MNHKIEWDSTWLFLWMHRAKKEPKCVCFHKTNCFCKATHGGAATRSKIVWYFLCNRACWLNCSPYMLSILRPRMFLEAWETRLSLRLLVSMGQHVDRAFENPFEKILWFHSSLITECFRERSVQLCLWFWKKKIPQRLVSCCTKRECVELHRMVNITHSPMPWGRLARAAWVHGHPPHCRGLHSS